MELKTPKYCTDCGMKLKYYTITHPSLSKYNPYTGEEIIITPERTEELLKCEDMSHWFKRQLWFKQNDGIWYQIN